MPIVEMPPHVRLICDDCGEEPGNDEFGGWFRYPADDIAHALHEACYHREGDAVICDNCAYERAHRLVGDSTPGEAGQNAGGDG